MPKLSERGFAHLLVPLILLMGIIGGVYLVSNGSLKLFSKAGGGWVVVKDLNGVAYPQINGVFQIKSSSVRLEIYAPKGLKPAVSSPNKIYTVSYKLAETPTELATKSAVAVVTDPTVVNFTLSPTPGIKYIWADFAESNGTVDRMTAQLNLVAACTEGVKTSTLGKYCTYPPKYSSITYTCYDGTTATLGKTGDCKTKPEWDALAQAACKGKTSCQVPLPSSSPSPVPTPVPGTCQSTISTFSLAGKYCGYVKLPGANFTCADGYKGNLGGQPGDCKSQTDWRNLAAKACASHTCPTPAPSLSPKPTPLPPTCRTGVSAFSLTGRYCGFIKLPGATYTCADGYKGTLGGQQGDCKSSAEWRDLANKACANHYVCPVLGVRVDKSTVEVTLDKANDQYGFIYGTGFTITSINANGWEIKNNEPVQGQGFYDASGGISPGRSTAIRSYINSNKALGTYSGSVTVRFAKNNTWYDGPKVTYKITLIDSRASAKRVFVTSTTYNGNLGGLSGADAKCQARANTANLGGTWKAWLSDSKTSAGSRLTPFKGQYKLLNGNVVANDWNDLTDGSIQNGINITELGLTLSDLNYGNYTWTNTNTGGQTLGASQCNDFTSSSFSLPIYNVGFVGPGPYNAWWTVMSVGGMTCGGQRHLYCFEQ